MQKDLAQTWNDSEVAVILWVQDGVRSKRFRHILNKKRQTILLRLLLSKLKMQKNVK
jgi:hypothetical protein